MRPLGPLCACLLAAAVGGCGLVEGGATGDCKVPPDRALLLAVRAHAGPVVITTTGRKGNAGRLTITACQKSDTDATATLTVFSLSDDSTRDIRHEMKLERRAGKWVVTDDSHTRRCYKGRGSKGFSDQKCV